MKGCRHGILWQSRVTSTASWFQGHVMYIHLDYKMLLLGEEEKHFAYVEVTGGRQGSLLWEKNQFRKSVSDWKISPFHKGLAPLHTPGSAKWARFFHGVAQTISARFTPKTAFDCNLWLNLSHVWLPCCFWQRSQNLVHMGVWLQMVPVRLLQHHV